MTHYTQADIAMANRHIAEGEAHIAHQRTLIARLEAQALPTDQAEKLLDLFRSTMVEHRIHRAAIIEAVNAKKL